MVDRRYDRNAGSGKRIVGEAQTDKELTVSVRRF